MNPAFLKQFKLSESEIAPIQAALQPNQTLLEVLFDKKLVDPVAYISWAKEHYALPALKIEFLNQTNNVEALLDRYKNVFPRNVIPFHEVDGVLYVMCLEPTPFDAPQTVQYILAPYEVIQKYSSKNESTAVTKSEIAIEVAVPENTNPLFKDLELSKNSLETFNFDSLTNANAKPTPEGDVSDAGAIQLEDKADVPSGLDFPGKPAEEESFVTNNPVTAVDLNSLSFVGIMPTEHKVEPTPQAPAQVTPAVAASAPATEAPKVDVQAVIKPKPVKVDTSKPFTPATASSLAARHPPKPKVEPIAAAPAAPAVETIPDAPPTMPPIAPPLEMPSFAAPMAEVSSIAPASLSQFDGILNSMKKYFDQCMLLMFVEGNLEPQAWDQAWSKTPHSQSAIDISSPSIFRIVNETVNPYHGYVVPNQINESFFMNWNKGIYPEHVTICPVVVDKKVYGMILGSTTKEGAKKYQLHHVQEIANDVVTLLSSLKAA